MDAEGGADREEAQFLPKSLKKRTPGGHVSFMHLAIDPGEDTGWALYDLGVLIACGLGDPRPSNPLPIEVLIERPEIRPGGRARPNDIITLALNAGEWAGRYRSEITKVSYVTPVGWKGSVPKTKHHPRILARLTFGETLVLTRSFELVAGSKEHNIVDAVGLGLHMVGRNANHPVKKTAPRRT